MTAVATSPSAGRLDPLRRTTFVSYDLIVRSTGESSAEISGALELPGAIAFESSQTERGVTFFLNGSDAEIAAFVHHLLLWARRTNHVVDDPQRGDALTRLGQLDWLIPSVKGKTLATRLKNLAKDRLAAHGFEFQKPRTLERRVDVLRQGFEFLPARGDRLSVNVFWSLELGAELNPGSYTAVARLDQLGPDASGPAESFAQAVAQLFDHGLPHLDRYASAGTLLDAVEAGELEVAAAFGPSVGWQVYYRALCLHHVGRVAEGIAAMRDLVANHSLHPFQEHAKRMRAEGREDFAAQAEADFAKLEASGRSWLQKERREYAEQLIERWSRG